jgi:hypothetical protein
MWGARLGQFAYSSNAETTHQMAHQSPRDDSTIVINAGPSARAVSRSNFSRRDVASWPLRNSARFRWYATVFLFAGFLRAPPAPCFPSPRFGKRAATSFGSPDRNPGGTALSPSSGSIRVRAAERTLNIGAGTASVGVSLVPGSFRVAYRHFGYRAGAEICSK